MFKKSAKRCGVALLIWIFAASCPVLPQTTTAVQSVDSSREVGLQVIVVRTPEEARDTLAQLKQGADFAQLAREKSIDPTAATGGFLGKLLPNSLRAELRDALSGVGAGEMTAVVHIPSGYAILKVVKDGNEPVKQVDVARNFALAATGAVKYTVDVDGLTETEAALFKFPKASGWNGDPHKVCELRKQSMTSAENKLVEYLALSTTNETAKKTPIDVMQMHYALAQLYSFRGEMDLAIEQYQAAYKLALFGVTDAIPQMEEALGISYLHKAEMENDAYRAPGKKCLFPMKVEDAYKKTENSQKAADYFLKYLKRKPYELEVKWLLNVTYMTMGKYPKQIPHDLLLPPSAFESKEDIGRFVDIAFETGLQSFSSAGGVIVDDFENNGLLDVVTSSFASCGGMHYFHNNGDGTFTDNTAKSGVGDQIGGLNMIQADYNNDGCLDILVLRGGWEFPQRKSLLRNNCNGTFTDVTMESGLAEPTSSQAAVWVDINNDGLLDLFVGNEWGPAELFLNKGDGTFRDIAIEAGVSGDGSAFSKGVTAADYDGDGYVDLYVSNLNRQNFLYHNNHDNTFTEVARKAGVPGSEKGFATWLFDYDNDGLPDLFTTSYYTSVDDTVRTYLRLQHNAATLRLYRNHGNGTFRDVTAETALDKVFMPMGANFGDIDNDGYLDIYLGTGSPSYGSLVPNVLLRNHDGKYFVDVTTSSGTGELHKGHAVAFADLSNSGFEDIVEEVGGATIGDAHTLRLFKNPGNGNDWITLKLVGVKTNRGAIGARIKVTVDNAGAETRTIWRTVGSGGSFGASPLQQHIGLGKSARIVSIEVEWPVSKTKQVFRDVEKNQFLEVKELSEQYVKLQRKSFQLRGASGTVPGAFNAAAATAAAKD